MKSFMEKYNDLFLHISIIISLLLFSVLGYSAFFLISNFSASSSKNDLFKIIENYQLENIRSKIDSLTKKHLARLNPDTISPADYIALKNNIKDYSPAFTDFYLYKNGIFIYDTPFVSKKELELLESSQAYGKEYFGYSPNSSIDLFYIFPVRDEYNNIIFSVYFKSTYFSTEFLNAIKRDNKGIFYIINNGKLEFFADTVKNIYIDKNNSDLYKIDIIKLQNILLFLYDNTLYAGIPWHITDINNQGSVSLLGFAFEVDYLFFILILLLFILSVWRIIYFYNNIPKPSPEQVVEMPAETIKVKEEIITEPAKEHINKDSKTIDFNEFFNSIYLADFQFTNKELQIIPFILKGLSNKEIADLLGISEGTIKNHLYNIYQKANVRSRRELILVIKNYIKNL